ncbi:hypothetical protein H4J02_11305 [Protaetiibacter sp. SSC-01]|uniref:hypothetical protein n=1 Tax=Protaetiibacter sp. SSC-01 TaxID=2759943 RepID=UPI0016573AEA|nr:hypothetical protein [Protaetiibacter sp. SSC-01]QNO37040.1 hypothetical protein H4J02_11305 [Protaetiibacter sp. SSC-01]
MTLFREDTIRRATTVSTWAAAVYLAAIAISAVVIAVATAANFSGYGVDGPFQLYNPLRRMAEGELPGRDFPFFHGPGVVAIHYPLFSMLGGNIFASEIARWLVSPALFLGSGYLFFWSALRGKRAALIAIAVATAIVLPFDRMVDPSNSLLGIRTTFPLLAAAAYFWTPRRHRMLGPIRIDWSRVLVIVALGVAVPMGTEQGAAAIGAYLLVSTVRQAITSRSVVRTLASTAFDTFALLVAVLLATAAFTGGHAMEALRYAFIDVPADQGWVFGAPPNTNLTWEALRIELLGGWTFRLSPVPVYWLMALLAIASLVVLRRLRVIGPRILWPAAFLLVYGLATLASVVGYVNLRDQMAPLARVSAMLLVLLAMLTIMRADRLATLPSGRVMRTGIVRGITGGIVVVMVVLIGASSAHRAQTVLSVPVRSSFAAAPASFGAPDADIVGEGWRMALDAFAPHIADDEIVWSTYQGLYQSVRGQLTPAAGGEDYIIHAVGAERRDAYTASFVEVDPRYVITLNPNYSIYEEWLWSRFPQFYERVFTHYRIVAVNGTNYLWERLDEDARATSWTALDLTDGVAELPAADDEVRLFEVEVEYEAGTSIGPLDRLPRYLVDIEDSGLAYPVAVPPQRASWTFFVPSLPGQGGPQLSASTIGIVPSAELDITGIRYREVDVDSDSRELFVHNFCITSVEQRPEAFCDDYRDAREERYGSRD